MCLFCYFLNAALDFFGFCYVAKVGPIFSFAKPFDVFLAPLVIIITFFVSKINISSVIHDISVVFRIC